MVALYRCGRQSEALDVYRKGSRLLRDELGIEPSPELRDLEQQILTHDEELSAPRRRRRPVSLPPAPSAHDASRPRKAGWLLVGGASLIISAGGVAIAERSGGSHRSVAPVAIDAAPNSMVVVDPTRSRPVAAVPLPGRPIDVAADSVRLWVTTVDAASLTSIDAKTRRILRTTPLRGRPDAVATGAGSVWVADSSTGVLARVRPGYGTVLRRIRFPRAAAPPARAERLRVPRATLAATPKAVWLTNGSRSIFRIDTADEHTDRIDVGGGVSAVTAGAGAVWALAP
jgi:hypothetical protein